MATMLEVIAMVHVNAQVKASGLNLSSQITQWIMTEFVKSSLAFNRTVDMTGNICDLIHLIH